MRVLGLMSGTSADGIDVALVRIAGAPPRLRARLENFLTVPYPARVRQAILRLANGAPTTAGELSQLNFLVGELFARAALRACRRFGVSPRRIDLIGSHGQTLFHQGRPGPVRRGRLSEDRSRPAPILGCGKVASTLQIAEPAVIAARTGIPTVGDFRPADMAAGGEGAPLVPFVDYLLCRHARLGRVALNLGGVANVTVIPRAARPAEVFAFDTGPGNMVMDALVARLTRGRAHYDRNARWARRGRPLRTLLDELLADQYFLRPPPKTAGREQFGERYAAALAARARSRYKAPGRARPEDAIATATALTALSILDAFHRWILPRAQIDQVIVSGGGAHNPLILAQLAAGLRGVEILPSRDLGVPEDAKEAFAFAVLAYETWHGRPANLPGATGARRAAILGKIIHV
jgi:anhydro-N-acetylmuramic acid kinase